MSSSNRSDKALNDKWDIAISNALVKTGLGFGVGVIGSVIFFRRRAWPVLLGTGFGLGKSWAEGDALFRVPIIPPAEAGVRQVKA